MTDNTRPFRPRKPDGWEYAMGAHPDEPVFLGSEERCCNQEVAFYSNGQPGDDNVNLTIRFDPEKQNYRIRVWTGQVKGLVVLEQDDRPSFRDAHPFVELALAEHQTCYPDRAAALDAMKEKAKNINPDTGSYIQPRTLRLAPIPEGTGYNTQRPETTLAANTGSRRATILSEAIRAGRRSD